MKIPITHNKKRIPSSNFLINCISARIAPQILSLKDECTFLLFSFLIIFVCNYPANFMLEIFSFLIAPQEVFLSKKIINHSSKAPLISIIFRIFSNIKCFIMQGFIRSFSSIQIFKILNNPCYVGNKLYLVPFHKYILNLLFL